jgi:hypothetical protein
MTRIEYAEKVLGIKLLDYQKDLLKRLDELDDDKLYLMMPSHQGLANAKTEALRINAILGGNMLYGASIAKIVTIEGGDVK